MQRNLSESDGEKQVGNYTYYPVNIIAEIIGIMGFIFNLFVLFVLLMFKNPRSKSAGNEFMITCQCIIDAMASFFVFLATVLERSWSENLKKGDLLDEFICRIWIHKCPVWSSLVASTYSVLALTVDRYLAVIHPIFYQARFSKSVALPKILSLSFIITVLMGTYIYLILASGIQDDGKCHHLSDWPENFRRSMGFLILVFHFFFPLTVIIFCYIRMVLALRHRINPIQEKVADNLPKQEITKLNSNEVAIWSTHGDKTNESKDFNDMNQLSIHGRNGRLIVAGAISPMRKIRLSLLKTSALLSASYLACWSGNQVYYFLYNLGIYQLNFREPYYYAAIILLYSNGLVNSIIYGTQYGPFKSGMKMFISKLPFEEKRRKILNSSQNESEI